MAKTPGTMEWVWVFGAAVVLIGAPGLGMVLPWYLFGDQLFSMVSPSWPGWLRLLGTMASAIFLVVVGTAICVAGYGAYAWLRNRA